MASATLLKNLRNNYFLFSFKGGGQRGLITSCFLKSLEDFLRCPILDAFDRDKIMFGGTSTGALIAGGLATGMSAAAIQDVYLHRTPEIFDHPPAVAEVWMLARGYRFYAQNIYDVVQDILGPAKDWKLNDCPVRVLLTAVGPKRKMIYFVRDSPHNSRYSGQALLIDAMVASAAASTYFSQWYVHPSGDNLLGWSKDGGLGGVANPILRLAVEAFEYDVFNPRTTRILCFGTGSFPANNVNPPTGLLATIQDAVDSLLDVADDEQSRLVQLMYKDTPVTYFDVALPRYVDEADLSARDLLLDLGTKAAAQVNWELILAPYERTT